MVPADSMYGYMVFYLWRVVGANVSVGFNSWIWISKAYTFTDFYLFPSLSVMCPSVAMLVFTSIRMLQKMI